MEVFMKALISENRSAKIPEEKDYFGKLIGEWEFSWHDGIGTEKERIVKGEWIFSRILEGTGIQDLFICPSREERKKIKEPDAEYGTTIRTYNPKTGNWDIYYCCYGESTRLEAVKEEDKIILTEITKGEMKWMFSDIQENSFLWQRIIKNEEGGWTVNCNCQAVRKIIDEIL
ncbi:hypothetical protein [Kineothrix sedimenti]|uniref:DUF3598 domain-containing protein n=1 Tax=Kineothrix sedimenti TaxID=3123317 RepID=A0ABZ3F094_9FIRM